MADSVTVYRIQTHETPPRRLGMAGSKERAEEWARVESAALHVEVDVIPVDVVNPLWGVRDHERIGGES